jgi:hypothetical protein
MSTGQPAPAVPAGTPGAPAGSAEPSIHVTRARKLLFAGLAGGLVAAVLATGVLAWVFGAPGLAGALLGSGMVLVFYGVGQLVMVAFANAGARTLLLVSMASYTGRVVVLGLLLLLYSNNRDSWPALTPVAVFISAIAVVVGWLVVEVWTFSRLRIGIYDTEYSGSASQGDAQ